MLYKVPAPPPPAPPIHYREEERLLRSRTRA